MNIFEKIKIFINGKEISGVDDLDDVKINTITGNHGTTIVINGKEIDHEDGEINIEINGNINHFNLPSGSVTVNGDVAVNNGSVGKITTTSGNVNISGNCTDKISTTSGNVTVIGA